MTEAAQTAVTRAARVRLMIFDVDGVLTDGSLQYGPEGEAIKTFNVHDGLGIKLLRQAGVKTAIITARNSVIVAKRAADLGIDHVQQSAHDKQAAFEQLLAHFGLAAEQAGFIGDDWIDLPVLTRAGFAVGVANARAEVRERAHFVTHADGGQGAVRELCEFILRAQGSFEAALAPYLE